MRPGLFPGQQRALRKALKKADKFDHFRQRTRRAFFGAILGGAAMSVAAFVVGRGRMASTTEESGQSGPRPQDPFAALALGPIEKLETHAVDLLAEIELGRASSAHWIGVERLALRALADLGPNKIRARLLRTRDAVKLPPELESVFAGLDAMAKGR
jgi:hypothetical protein